MIESLMVQNYILFEKANVDFQQNMAVITGETGAGKSLLIDAIAALSGGRITSGTVRKGAEKAVLEMVLSDPSEQVKEMLEENGYDAEEQIIITRIIQSSGKSRMMVNARTATNAFVKRLVSKMIDVHSQMDTHTLMDPQIQLEMLDRYAKNGELKEKTAQAYSAWQKTALQLRKLQQETFSNEQLDFITAQLNEIEQAAIQEGELEDLQERIRQASSLEKNMEDFSSVLYAWKKEGGIQELLFQSQRTLKKNQDAQNLADKMDESYYTLSDLFDQIEEKKEALSGSADDLDAMQDREYLIKKLLRKYGGSYEMLLETKERLQQQVDRILHRQDLFDRLEKEKAAAAKVYLEAAAGLSASRKAVTKELEELVEKHARDMMLEHCVFQVHIEKGKPGKDGVDALEFYASMNPGQAPTPLKQSASGGELSRLMLALKVVFQADNGIGTLVFDEIDTGVSGRVALAMGSKMHALAEKYQVLCITHLPSVAVWADDHFLVSKKTDGTVTTTSVKLLDEEEHAKELAVMSSGSAAPSAVASMKNLIEEVRHG